MSFCTCMRSFCFVCKVWMQVTNTISLAMQFFQILHLARLFVLSLTEKDFQFSLHYSMRRSNPSCLHKTFLRTLPKKITFKGNLVRVWIADPNRSGSVRSIVSRPGTSLITRSGWN